MPPSASRRQFAILAGLGAVLIVVLAVEFAWWGGSAPSSRPTAPVRKTPGAAGGGSVSAVPGVKLAELKAPRPEPAPKGRNLFRDQPPPPPPAPRYVAPPQPVPDPNAPPPGPPPIPLKFIGIVQAQGGPIAVLTDGRDVFYGREGTVVEGRYRIIKIGVESIEISYADGRGQQRLRLTS